MNMQIDVDRRKYPLFRAKESILLAGGEYYPGDDSRLPILHILNWARKGAAHT